MNLMHFVMIHVPLPGRLCLWKSLTIETADDDLGTSLDNMVIF